MQHYWRDVGTVDAFYDANMELIYVNPELNIYDEQWPIWTYQRQYPPAKFVLDEDGRRGMAVNSMVSGGCIISGATVNQSLLFSNVRIDERSYIERSVIFPDVKVGAEQHHQARHRRHRRRRASRHADRRQPRGRRPPLLHERARASRW